MKRGLTLFAVLSMALVLSACTIIPEPEQVSTYRLPPVAMTDNSQDRQYTTNSPIRVSRPLVTDLLGTNRVLRLSPQGEFSAYAGARWSANVPVLWRDWMVDSLMQSGFSVSADVENIHTKYELGTTLRAFHIETGGSALQARITLDARVINNSSRQVLGSHRFDIQAPVRSGSAQAAVQALGIAANQLSDELSAWLASQEL